MVSQHLSKSAYSTSYYAPNSQIAVLYFSLTFCHNIVQSLHSKPTWQHLYELIFIKAYTVMTIEGNVKKEATFLEHVFGDKKFKTTIKFPSQPGKCY